MSKRALLLALTMAVSGCGAEAIVGPLIVLTNTWRNEAVEDHRFSLSDNTNGTPRREGTFTGTEFTPNFEEFDLTGSWTSDGHVQFTVQRPGGAVTYSGRLTSNVNRMELSSATGHLVLVRP
jgi:hypothetical protein